MDEANQPGSASVVLEDELIFTLADLSGACRVHAETVIALVEEGVLEPQGEDTQHWRFTGANLRRAQAALRLQRDLGVNLAGAALALDLLDEIQILRARVATLERSP